MDRIRKLLNLPQNERWLLVKAAALLASIRLALRLLPFSYARRVLRWVSHPSRRLSANPISVERIAWAVNLASRFVPGAGHCLTQALAGQVLLIRRGYPAEVRFGVLRDSEKSNFMAHAWVESNGVVVIGGTDVNSRYVRLNSWADPIP